ncbi:hypothetical protein BV898_13630 [Hypsibius exemplaris]|uniref:Uncharacterized protein n=1 Tax=Hypsibius exemplaris TaxID=2072580 RepID=A0A1W0WA70_HYPEX|nr:hypothetical protein BV898_13630 [Hypsibius exemplaris]
MWSVFVTGNTRTGTFGFVLTSSQGQFQLDGFLFSVVWATHDVLFIVNVNVPFVDRQGRRGAVEELPKFGIPIGNALVDTTSFGPFEFEANGISEKRDDLPGLFSNIRPWSCPSSIAL